MESSSPTYVPVGLVALPTELILAVAAKLRNPKDVLALAGTCKKIRLVLRSMARPCVELLSQSRRDDTCGGEAGCLGQLRRLSSVRMFRWQICYSR